MKISGYIMGSIEAILGCLILAGTSVIREVLPKLGRIAYQNAAAGSYSYRDYEVSFGLAATVAVILIAAGIAQILYFCFKKK